MGSLRVASIPIEHVVAEMTAYPLASEAAFRLGILELPREPSAVGPVPADELWRAAEQEIGHGCPNFSLDELIEIRDCLWYQREKDEPRGESLVGYLRRVASRNLEGRGGAVTPTLRHLDDVQGDPTRDAVHALARRSWRWLSFAVPPDLLVAAHPSVAARADRPVASLSPAMERMLADRGFAETHLHVGAGMRFPTLWIATLRALTHTDLREDAFQSPGAAFGEGRDFAAWLIRAAVARYVLAAFLAHRRQFGLRTRCFTDYLRRHARLQLLGALPLTWLATLDLALKELAAGCFLDDGPSFAAVRAAYAAITCATGVRFPKGKRKIPSTDPVAALLPSGCRSVDNPEAVFVARSLGYLWNNEDDRAFASLFWQAVRVRALFYRHIVQRPMTPGLQWFVRTYGRIGAGRRPVSVRSLVELAAETCGLGRGLRSLEVRTTPDHQSAMLGFVDDCDKAFAGIAGKLAPSTTVSGQRRVSASGRIVRSPRRSSAEFGIVLHFAKLRAKDTKKGKPKPGWIDSNADPKWKGNGKGYRYGNYYVLRRPEALGLARLLLNFPRSLKVVRGVDVCTDELSVPTWVIKPLYDYLRCVGERVSAQLCTASSRRTVPPLRFTAHAGEDFVHLLGGLRRVSESVRWLGLREGDRIGHGVALGIDASRWAAGAGRVAVAREERLFDLAWEWDCYTRHGVLCSTQRMATIEREIVELAKCIFEYILAGNRTPTPHDIVVFVKDLHDRWALQRMGFPESEPPDLVDFRSSLLLGYLTDPVVFERGRETKWIDPSPEGSALENLQDALRGRITAVGISVEVNPSSNLLIGNLGEFQQHPLWRLRPPRPDGTQQPVPICIGSDDPLTFAADLPTEYMLVHDSLVLGGLDCDAADRWLDDVRKTGLNTRFTIPRRLPARIRKSFQQIDDAGIPPIL